jgi:hypothetical protein
MAATNFTPIQLYHSSTASAAPTAGNLANGELAINITDGKLYYKDNAGVVQVIATKGAGTIGGSTTQIQYNNAGALAGSAAMTFNSGTSTVTLTTLNLTNALGATFGGTAQSAYTQGDILYSSATNTLAKLGIGTVNFILTSTGSVPQWVAPSSISVNTATNLAGGLAGSVPYQSALDTTTFLAIGAANRVMTSTGTAPQWVTSLSGLTGVTSSSLTNTSLTSGRVVLSTAGGQQTDDADLTFDGTTLSAGGLSTAGFSTQVKTVTLGNSNFNGVAVFAPSTPAKLYLGTGVVTDVTSAAASTNTTGAIASLAITPIAATNASVTYTNASTLYIAGAPSASTNVTITNPYSLYIAAGAAYFGGGLTFAGQLNVTDATDSSSTTTGSIVTAGGVGIAKKLFVGLDANIYGLTVGRGAGAVATNTAVGASALVANTTGNNNTAVGQTALTTNTTGNFNTAVGRQALFSNLDGTDNSGFGLNALVSNTSGSYNTGIGRDALQANTTASNNTAVGYQAGYANTTGAVNTFVGGVAGKGNTTGYANSALGYGALFTNTTGFSNTAIGATDNSAVLAALQSNTTGAANTAMGVGALASNTTASNNTAVGYQAGYANTTGTSNVFMGLQAGYSNTTDGSNTYVGKQAGYFTTSDGNTALGAQAFKGASGTSTGRWNTAVGAEALTANTSGSYNAALGGMALQANTTGTSNTAVGGAVPGISNGALELNTTGSNNIAVGSGALRSNTTASNNTAVGYQAGYSGTTAERNTLVGQIAGYALTTGSANVVLGDNAFKTATTADNCVAIGTYALADTTGALNTAIGSGAGEKITTGTKNTILGRYNGNQGGLDIRTASNNIVLSDGDGNPRFAHKSADGATSLPGTSGQFSKSSGTFNSTLQLGDNLQLMSFKSGSNTQSQFASNTYYNGSYKYIDGSAGASKLALIASGFEFSAAGAGSADAAITFESLFGMAGNGNTVYLQGGVQNASGTGITFPATQAASTNANTLDDYEEGTFTPVLNFAGSTAGITYDIQLGRYTKVGNVVNVQIGLVLTSKGSAAGALQMAGLPFTAINPGAYGDGSLAISFCSAATATTPMMAIVQRGNTQLAFNFTTTSSSDSVENTDVTDSFAIILGGSYISA